MPGTRELSAGAAVTGCTARSSPRREPPAHARSRDLGRGLSLQRVRRGGKGWNPGLGPRVRPVGPQQRPPHTQRLLRTGEAATPRPAELLPGPAIGGGSRGGTSTAVCEKGGRGVSNVQLCARAWRQGCLGDRVEELLPSRAPPALRLSVHALRRRISGISGYLDVSGFANDLPMSTPRQ